MRHAMKAANWALRIADPPAKGWDLAVVDQGIVQEVWSTVVGSSRWSTEALRRLLRTVFARAPIAPVFVHLQVEPAIALERVNSRSSMRSRFDRMSDDCALQLLERHVADLELASRLVVEVTDAPHLRIDASASIPEMCREVTEFVESCAALEGASR
jgi:thymidylate kinase